MDVGNDSRPRSFRSSVTGAGSSVKKGMATSPSATAKRDVVTKKKKRSRSEWLNAAMAKGKK